MHDIKHYSIDGSEKTSFQSEHISISIGIDRLYCKKIREVE